MSTLREYLISFHDNLPGMLPVPYYPGWSVSLNVRNKRYRDAGYIFMDKDQAEIWAKSRVLPDKYWQIDWRYFPDNASYIYRVRSSPL